MNERRRPMRLSQRGAGGTSQLKQMSKEDWAKTKDMLINLSSTGSSDKQLVEELNTAGYTTNVKVVNKHLNKWGSHRYAKPSAKEQKIEQIRAAHAAATPLPALDAKQIRSLRRYVSDRKPPFDDDQLVLSCLDEIASQERSAAPQDGNAEEYPLPPDGDPWQIVNSPGLELPMLLDPIPRVDQPNLAVEGGLVNPLMPSEHQHSVLIPQPTVIGQDSNEVSSQDRQIPIVRQPHDFNNKFKAISKICGLTQRYYQTKLYEYILSAAFANASSDNRNFWTKVKSGIYYLKIPDNASTNNSRLARIELGEAWEMIPKLVQTHQFSILKDVHATMSPAAMPNLSALRIDILHNLHQAATSKLEPNHPFTQICSAMVEEEGSDELSVTAMRVMLDESEQILPQTHPDLFELRRAFVRLYRRNRKFAQAEQIVMAMMDSAADSQVGLALTEYVYILNDKGQYLEALDMAQAAVDCYKADANIVYPDEKAIYAMEDVAEICERLGRLEDSLSWLKDAFRAALARWGGRPQTLHIWEKLEGLHDKRYRQMAMLANVSC